MLVKASLNSGGLGGGGFGFFPMYSYTLNIQLGNIFIGLMMQLDAQKEPRPP